MYLGFAGAHLITVILPLQRTNVQGTSTRKNNTIHGIIYLPVLQQTSLNHRTGKNKKERSNHDTNLLISILLIHL